MVKSSGNTQLFPHNKVTQKSLPSLTSLETDFPATEISKLGEKESWRKEVFRPATHTHKWWAKRLGTVFRGIIVSAVASDSNDALEKYSSSLDLSNLVLFDPFAGSGTTLVESAKLGIRTIGRDINPVATLVQRQALTHWDKRKLQVAFDDVATQCKSEIEKYYRSENGETVLYYFWVAITNCPECAVDVELFSNHIFSRHAYPKKYTESRAVCVECWDVFMAHNYDEQLTCSNGHTTKAKGSVSGQNMTCKNGHTNKILPSLNGNRPRYKMYAKMVMTSSGKKSYQAISDFDVRLYNKVERDYKALKSTLVTPAGKLEDGVNTRQAKSWGFDTWEKFFNTRQLLTLGLLANAIKTLNTDEEIKEALATLFSGTLEFNNLFCSFKGEGTGAVRHMFSHHILKPERVPLEANPWGTKSSSGSFSTLFNSRLLRAFEYKTEPTDLILVNNEVVKTSHISKPLNEKIVENWQEFQQYRSSAYVVSGDSSRTDIPDESVDLVITDPPYMDNVHYSELADFFHAWLKQMAPYKSYNLAETTRSIDEVQSPNPDEFSVAIEKVWKESERVLKPDGLVAFTFHQARITGWVALVKALKNAGLVITAIQPIKGEMTTSVTKAGAANPSNLDSVVVCRKAEYLKGGQYSIDRLFEIALERLANLKSAQIKIGSTDVYSVVRGAVLAAYTQADNNQSIEELTELANSYSEKALDSLLN